MRWFRHNSDSHQNLKLRQIIGEFGMRGYGLYWVCVELVAHQGTDFRIKCTKNWKNALLLDTRESKDEIEKILNAFAEVNLIDKKALKAGDLFIPKMVEYSDEYTKKVRRLSRQDTDNVVLQDKTIHNNTTHNKTAGIEFEEFWKLYPNKVNKKKAEIKWHRLPLADQQAILEDVAKRKESPPWLKDGGAYIPHPTTYLNGERWKDELSVKTPAQSTPVLRLGKAKDKQP